MDFKYRYTQEQEDFRREVRSWLEENVPEDMKAPVDRLDLTEEHHRFSRETHMKLAAKAFFLAGDRLPHTCGPWRSMTLRNVLSMHSAHF